MVYRTELTFFDAMNREIKKLEFEVDFEREYNVILYTMNLIDEYLACTLEKVVLQRALVYKADNPLYILLNVVNY